MVMEYVTHYIVINFFSTLIAVDAWLLFFISRTGFNEAAACGSQLTPVQLTNFVKKFLSSSIKSEVVYV